MPPGEFELIDRYFRPLTRPAGLARPDVVLGIGDDGALLTVPPGQQLVAALDTLGSGAHFLPDCDPKVIGHRALAVNLSDLAAMGAMPAWALLALTLPQADESFLQGFATGFAALAARHGVALVGGDTTAGPLTVSVQVLGSVPAGQALRRDGASAGDLLFVSGTVGDAAAGLLLERGAQGGVVAQPTFFASNGGVGLMGERGAEAIMPLARGPDGRLGVAAGPQGVPVSVTVNIAASDAESFRRSQVQITSALARAVARGQRGL